MTHDQGPIHPLDEKKLEAIVVARAAKLDEAKKQLDIICDPNAPDKKLSFSDTHRRIHSLCFRLDRLLGYIDLEVVCDASDSEGNGYSLSPDSLYENPPEGILGMELGVVKPGAQGITSSFSANMAGVNLLEAKVNIPGINFYKTNTEKAMLATETVVGAMLSPFEEALNLPPLPPSLRPQ